MTRKIATFLQSRVESDETSDKVRRIFITNIIALVLGTATLPYIYIFYSLKLRLLAVLIIPVSISFFSCIFINYRRRYTLARIILIMNACIAASLYDFLLGYDAGVYKMSFFYIFIPFFVFQNKKKIVPLLGLILFFYGIVRVVFLVLKIDPLFKIERDILKFVRIVPDITVFAIIIASNYYNSKMTQFYKDRLKNRNEELIIAHEELKMKSRTIHENLAYKAALGTLVTGIHHEIRNPMNIIRVGCETIKIKKDDSEYVNNTCDDIIEAIDRLNKISTLMLEYGRESSKDDKKEINVNKVINAFSTLSKSYFNKKNIVMKLRLNDVYKVYANDNQIYQIIMNLVLNASESMIPHGGEIEISTANTEFIPANSKSNINKKSEGIAIKIKDTGPGIPQENLKHILNPFFSTKNTHTGLGLSIVLNIVLSYNGNIEFYSEPDKGTEVTIHLPKI